MPSTATTRLRFEKQGQGENLNTWGDRLNTVLDLADEAIAGVEPITISASAVTLTSTNYVSDQARNAALVLTGTLTANTTIQAPTVEKLYLVDDQTTRAGFTLTIKTAAGSGYALRPGPQKVYCDGTDFRRGEPRLDQVPLAGAAVDMNGQKLSNLGTPTASTDAVTKAYADTVISSAQTYANAAQASAGNAATSETNAGLSATSAANSATAAANSVANTNSIWCGTATGTDAITLTPSTALGAYAAGITIRFKTAGANTGAVTVNVSGLGAKNLKDASGNAVTSGAMGSGEVIEATYDGTEFRRSGGAGSGSPFSTSVAKSADYTVLAADAGTAFYVTGATRITLSSASTLGAGWRGGVVNSGSSTVQIACASGNTINGISGGIRLVPGDAVLLHCDGTRIFAFGSKAASVSGYIMGGYNGGYLSSIEKYAILSAVMGVVSTTLAVARGEAAGVNSDITGYALGGYTGSVTNEINGIKFATDAANNPAATLSSSLKPRSGANSTTKGYSLGGDNGSSPVSTICGFTFASETAGSIAATLSAARSRVASVSSTTKGYALGGDTPSNVVDGITFATDAAFTGANTLPATRDAAAGVNSLTAGYAMSGNGLTSTAKIVFATEATSTLADTLAVNRGNQGGFNDEGAGYVFGNGSNVTSGSKLDFSTEATSTLSAALTTGRQTSAVVQSGGLL